MYPSNQPTLVRARGPTVLLSILLLTSAVVLPMALASDPECVPGSFVGSCAFTGSTPGGVYVYDTIVIPAGVTVTAALPLVLHARQELRIEGNIADTPSITLTADLTATVSGTVRALDGTSANPDGGDIQVFANLLNLVGTLQSGSGAPGADMVQDVQDAANTVTSAGAPGGNGGDIVVVATSALVNGVFIVGNGGKGGSAVALGGTQAAFAAGGMGGASGQLVLPAGYDPLTLAHAGAVGGGLGGDGGDATAESSSVIPPTSGEIGDAATNDKGAAPACSGAPKTSPAGAMGNSGCQGARADAYAGDGGYGLVRGGAGGFARAVGGQGGNGGRGVDGARASCYFFNQAQPSCPAYYGGQGGQGGIGGPAYAEGGNGGNSLLEGGSGGNALASGGNGGTGGTGATGGGGYVIGWNGDAAASTLAAIGCMAAIYDGASYVAVVACTGAVFLGTSYRYACGNGGAAGPGGLRGTAGANGGAGGRNLEGLGTSAPAGSGNSNPGGTGANGSPGGKTPVPMIFPSSGSDTPTIVYLCA